MTLTGGAGMKYLQALVVVLLVTCIPAISAAEKQAVPLDPTDDRLAQLLQDWQQATQKARECCYHYMMTFQDTVFRTPPEVHDGDVFISRPNRLRYEWRDTAGKLQILDLRVDGKGALYQFEEKKVITCPVDSSSGWPGLPKLDSNVRGCLWDFSERLYEEFTWLHLRFPVWDLKDRFRIRLEKEDANWCYIQLTAKKRPDSDWQIVLSKDGQCVRRIWRMGAVNCWVDFTKPRVGPLPPQTWEPPFKELPRDWTTNR
jgi:hypothetical protein